MPANNSKLVTLFLFSYNQEAYIEAACQAALSQTYSPLEIIISDDFSQDKTYEIIQEIVNKYQGSHRVCCRQNNTNMGLIGHVNKAFQLSSGELIVAAAGDDISLPNRVECLVRAYKQSDETALVIHSSVEKISSSNGNLGLMVPPVIKQEMNLLEMAVEGATYIGATGAWSKNLYKKFGPVLFTDAFEDLVFGFRAAITNSLVYVDIPLVRYRVGIGLSSAASTPFWNISKRVHERKRRIKTFLDVLEQRLADLEHSNEKEVQNMLTPHLAHVLKFQRMKYLYYTNPWAVIGKTFSEDSSVALNVVYSETKYMIGSVISRVASLFHWLKQKARCFLKRLSTDKK